jgi:3-isopropylmalate/(R)-2-methylmalate dehydratase small subunit
VVEMDIRGRAWKLGDNISTDHIISGKYKFKAISSVQDMIPHVLEEVIPDFHLKVRKGDVIVAGRNFGMGSSREHAPLLLKMLGISAIIAESFARIFFRNSINIGLPVITALRIPKATEEGDILHVDVERGILINVSKGVEEQVKPYPREILDILECGGIIEYVKRYGDLPWQDTR